MNKNLSYEERSRSLSLTLRGLHIKMLINHFVRAKINFFKKHKIN